MSSIQESFDVDGLLLPGTHIVSKAEFLESFCSSEAVEEDDGLPRHRFNKPFYDICEWADEAGATSIVIGGSFVSKKISPSDIDLLIFFANSTQIPKSLESFYVDGVSLDIQLLSEEETEIKAAFLELLATTRNGVGHGIVQIKFNSQVVTHQSPDERSIAFDIVKTAYLGRKFAQLNEVKGLLVPIHGIRTHADWIPQVTLLASTSGWAVAPYYYGYQDVSILGNEDAKEQAVQGLRDWMTNIRLRWAGPVSIVAHSFGTYLVARYLRDAKDLTIEIDSIIFCGSIVRSDYDWLSLLDSARIGRVLNTVSEVDEWVQMMPIGGIPLLAKDKLFGRGGCVGFRDRHPRLTEIRSSLLGHNNMFKFDVMLGQWIPFLKLSIGAHRSANIDLMKRDPHLRAPRTQATP